MYYSVLMRNGCALSKYFSEGMKALSGVNILKVDCDTINGQCLMEHAKADGGMELPIVMAGDRVVGQGDNALFDLVVHSMENPHVHWEAHHEAEGDEY
jgi:hypothetical protein